MYVKSLQYDNWENARGTDERIDNPSLTDIELAIRAIDGKRRQGVILVGVGDAHLAVGGGLGGQFVVYATFDNERFFSLTSNDNRGSSVRLLVGGQEGEYPSHMIVNLDHALAAAQAFARSGQLAPQLQWSDK
jgi:hypothetical protein